MKTNNKHTYCPPVLSRKLVGINGSRFYNIPGVIYPESVLKAKPGYNPRTGEAYHTPPAWGIDTVKAAAILHCTPSAARLSLHQHRTRFQVVQEEGKQQQIYWSRKQVEQLASKRIPIATESEKGEYISTTAAMKQLGVTRTSMLRYVERGLLHGEARRIRTRCGLRSTFLYAKAEVERLAAAREAWKNCGDPMRPLEEFLDSRAES